VTWT